jgi:CheY-like chemotaxis protein
VVAKHDAYEGLRWLEQILPDLILLDVMLPGLSGIDMLARIRETENGNDVSVIIATAHWELSTEEFERYKVSAFIRKPISPADMVDIVKKVLDAQAE